MKNSPFKTKTLAALTIFVGFIVLGRLLLSRCPEPPDQIDINSSISIHYLYPWPGSKIPFACHTLAFLKSPFAPKMIKHSEMVFKEDGYLILGGYDREGVIVAKIAIVGDLYRQFPEPIKWETPPFVESISLYVDDKKLQIGHIGFRELDNEFNFTTILNPFLLPREHIGKVVIQLPSGKSLEYEWLFEITWW